MRPVTFANKVSSLPRPTFRPGLMGVPRCRTMIEPPGTNCPPKAFTPRRCAFESRPFLELPNPFLCAITIYLLERACSLEDGALCDDLVHFDAREVLAVSDGSLVLFLTLELECQELDAAAMGLDRALNTRTSRACARRYLIAVDQRQYAAELDLGSDVAQKRLYFNRIARRDAILFPACFNDC